MTEIILAKDIDQYSALFQCSSIDPALLRNRLGQRKGASFESYQDFSLMGFDWFALEDNGANTDRVQIFFNRENMVVICPDETALEKLRPMMPKREESAALGLRSFFSSLIYQDMELIDQYEVVVTDAEDDALQDAKKEYVSRILAFRRDLLRMKQYYTQMETIFDNLVDNENELLDEKILPRFQILYNRVNRCSSSVLVLRDYVTQMREGLQAQIDLEQNVLMKLFTLITALFLPLTLMVGWYGMNFRVMPELQWPYAYPSFILVSILFVIILLLFFKKKKWM